MYSNLPRFKLIDWNNYAKKTKIIKSNLKLSYLSKYHAKQTVVNTMHSMCMF